MLQYEQVFGYVFKRRERKCCAVLMKKHRRKVNDEQVTTLQIAQQLKTKNRTTILSSV